MNTRGRISLCVFQMFSFSQIHLKNAKTGHWIYFGIYLVLVNRPGRPTQVYEWETLPSRYFCVFPSCSQGMHSAGQNKKKTLTFSSVFRPQNTTLKVYISIYSLHQLSKSSSTYHHNENSLAYSCSFHPSC